MSVASLIPVKKLKLDLTNFRTVPQPDELHAIRAMVSISPDPFWALMESLLEDGYLPTESILVLKKGSSARPEMVVAEGNRRIAALKLIHGYISTDDLGIPENILGMIENLPRGWKTANAEVPCNVYELSEVKTVERIRALTHGKGEKAGRDHWKAIARARHNRDENGESEFALDLLEKYLKSGKNLTEQQRERWAGDYPLTVLDEVIKKLAPRLGAANSRELSGTYPKIKNRDALESIMRDIGLENVTFKSVRATADFAAPYGVPALTGNASGTSAAGTAAGAFSGNTAGGSNAPASGGPSAAGGTATGGAAGNGGAAAGSGAAAGTGATAAAGTGRKTIAVAIHDPKEVARVLKKFKIKGAGRAKVAMLLSEIKNLKLEKNPLAFCFLLRSMFEISAKAYCDDHQTAGGPHAKNAQGEERKLIDILRDITKHLSNNNQDKAVLKALHGAIVELGKPEGILSVNSMNQLVHNPKFSVSAFDVATMFGNVFPLLEAMNQ